VKERRRFTRIPESSEITYRIISEAKTEHFITQNLSRGGVRFFVHEFIPQGTLLKIKLRLKKTSFSFEALAQVRWIEEDSFSERFEIGVKFVDISHSNTAYLLRYIDTMLKPE
jgi:c-di-GMP-binding flagellar brake protein YcgR